ncbi:RNA-directed DNA polymerase, eukaryota, reverse transcriptase zinc-binding domain protein [Tanacetum coccineum]
MTKSMRILNKDFSFSHFLLWGTDEKDACSDNYIIVEGKWLNSTDNYYLINVYGPPHQPDKENLWESLRIFAHQHVGQIILFGDLNEVRHENERFGTMFSSNDALIFNSFIDNVCLIDLPLGVKIYTWMNKLGTKLSKLDRFLVSDGVLNAHPHLQATVLDKVWSDHNPMLLHCSIFQLHISGMVPMHSIRFNIGDGSLIRFWKDTWLGDMPLCSRFNRLFYLDRDKNCLVKD